MSQAPERNERFDETLDELYEPMRIGELTFYPSDVMYHLDPIAYRVSVSDWESELEEELAE